MKTLPWAAWFSVGAALVRAFAAMRPLLMTLVIVTGALGAARADAQAVTRESRAVDVGDGVVLHYVEEGTGVPVIFVHGSLSDYEYWHAQLPEFSKKYRAIAYSRRYNYPNSNQPITGYSAVTDARDLASLIGKLRLGKVYVIGHSYGALTALLLATEHPELLRAVVLAEPPAIPLLRSLPDEQASKGAAMFTDIQEHMIQPMKAAFAKGDQTAGVGVFIDYVLNDRAAWERMSSSDRADTLRDAHEWDVMMTAGELFPEVAPEAVRRIRIPVLIMSGGTSYRFLQYIDQQLVRLLPHAESIVYPDTGHQMWYAYPVLCRHDTEAFFLRNP